MKIPNNILDGVGILFCKANEMIVVGEHCPRLKSPPGTSQKVSHTGLQVPKLC
jgi:hypothetical protein